MTTFYQPRELEIERMKRAGASGSSLASKKPKAEPGASGTSGHVPWHMKLLDSMRDPAMVVKSDEQTVTIKDGYPKARHHYLVMAKERIPNLRALKSSHVGLLEKMLENGEALAEEVKEKESWVTFRCGYHASPSMSRLHMHVVSQDLDSPCLKNKKHWNSFTTDFFLDAEKVVSMLRERGKVELDVKGVYEPLLKLPLECHVCKVGLQSMPKLKEHIRQHIPSPAIPPMPKTE